ncbi:hypothetical protein Hokovirus_1_300 [Hokovirus HKV1]|uniref:Uncharacterized protein n=1 Tax=Hokovirus HKV1 TaxID=1977638 RepID=A0A1V0SFG5_9VIRU|nr:hypothetical protein Hokovirus_1_300 [Hokovirus HKV1]
MEPKILMLHYDKRDDTFEGLDLDVYIRYNNLNDIPVNYDIIKIYNCCRDVGFIDKNYTYMYSVSRDLPYWDYSLYRNSKIGIIYDNENFNENFYDKLDYVIDTEIFDDSTYGFYSELRIKLQFSDSLKLIEKNNVFYDSIDKNTKLVATKNNNKGITRPR